MKKKKLTPAQRAQKTKDERTAKGLVRKEYWATPSIHADIEQLIKKRANQ